MSFESASEKSKLEAYLSLVGVIGAAVLGAVLGTTVTHFWTRSLALEEQVLNIKKSAYLDFLQGQSLLWQEPEKVKEANRLITSAKLTILLTSSHGVLCSMVSYWVSAHEYQVCAEPELRKKDAAIYLQMRQEFNKTLGIADAPGVEAAVVVPYIWSCLLPEEHSPGIVENIVAARKSIDRVCRIP